MDCEPQTLSTSPPGLAPAPTALSPTIDPTSRNRSPKSTSCIRTSLPNRTVPDLITPSRRAFDTGWARASRFSDAGGVPLELTFMEDSGVCPPTEQGAFGWLARCQTWWKCEKSLGVVAVALQRERRACGIRVRPFWSASSPDWAGGQSFSAQINVSQYAAACCPLRDLLLHHRELGHVRC